MMKKICAYLKDERGTSAVEYALLCALGVLVLVGAYAMYAELLQDFFTNFINEINPF